jgi:hypothetical protein
VSTTPARPGAAARAVLHTGQPRRRSALRGYFFSDGTRTVQSVLGVIWLLDGGLQFQSFMYSHGFIQSITSQAPGQPGWVSSSLLWGAHIAGKDLTLWNTLFALTQVAIGLGLLYRPTVKPALILCFGWSLFVWWFGEAFGMLFMNMAQPLSGAPGGVILYTLVGLVAWPNGKPGGLLGIRGTRVLWATLWLLMAYLWLLQASSSANAIHDMINAAPSGMSWLSSLQDGFASITKGNGLIFALIFAALSAVIAIGVGFNRYAKELLILSVVINVLFWLVGQGLGGIFQGGATDPNAAPLFILLAYAVYLVVPYQLRTSVNPNPIAT